MIHENEVQRLEDLGHNIVEEAGQDTKATRLHKAKDERKAAFYSDLIYTLMQLRFPEKQARRHWGEIIRHKVEMSKRLDRNVGVRVAALDYFKNIKGLLKSPKIVEVSEFAATSWRAVSDSLTGLYNHRYFQNTVNRNVNSVAKAGGCFSIFLFDIDFFKVYNDSNGHIAGDVVLAEIARILKKKIREDDVAARYGGEEFGVVFPLAGKKEALEIAERIRVAIKEFNFPNERVLPSGHITISGGIATCPQDGKRRKKLIAVVDQRLYKAKSEGRDRICYRRTL